MEQHDFIRFALADIYGRSKGRIVPTRHALKCIESGVHLHGGTLVLDVNDKLNSVPMMQFDCDRSPRIKAIPDMMTLHTVPWCGGERFKVAEVICESYWLQDTTPHLACPRYLARQQIKQLAHHGFKLLSGFEMEFVLLRKDLDFPLDSHLYCHREQAKNSEILFDIATSMFQAGVDIENLHPEYDPGSFEMALKPQEGILSADKAFTFKTGVLEIGDKTLYDVSFRSRTEDTVIGMQFNHSLWSASKNENLFADKLEELSEIGRYWLAGLLKHAKALTPLFNPTVNCYQRLHQPHTASDVFWAPNDRSACVKVKSSITGVYLENRIPSGMSNPYIVLAATVAAGLDGILNKLECPPPGRTTENESLPRSLPEALRCLREDIVLVDRLGKEFVEYFVATVATDIDDDVI